MTVTCEKLFEEVWVEPMTTVSKRLLSAGPETCERLEHQAVVAIEKSDWRGARMALHLRLKMRCAPTAKEWSREPAETSTSSRRRRRSSERRDVQGRRERRVRSQ